MSKIAAFVITIPSFYRSSSFLRKIRFLEVTGTRSVTPWASSLSLVHSKNPRGQLLIWLLLWLGTSVRLFISVGTAVTVGHFGSLHLRWGLRKTWSPQDCPLWWAVLLPLCVGPDGRQRWTRDPKRNESYKTAELTVSWEFNLIRGPSSDFNSQEP